MLLRSSTWVFNPTNYRLYTKFHFDTYYPSDVSFKGLIVMILANLNERQNVDISKWHRTTAISIEQMPLVEMPR
jgi:hypothetical protein